VCLSFLVGNERSLVQSRLVNGRADAAESLQPLLTTLTLADEATDRLLYEFVAALVLPAREFLFELFIEIGWQRHFH
jgi:hypothetical protein